MSIMFETTRIGSLELNNRFVRSATWEGMAEKDGAMTPRLSQWNEDLAKGGVGLIIASHAYVSPEGQATPLQTGIYKDELIPGLREMVDRVHSHGGIIVQQLAHGGRYAQESMTGRPALMVSEWDGMDKMPGKVMTKDDIAGLAEKFGRAAARAKKAGFDGVQIHSGHGYLLSQFLSPAMNQRTDEYGGPIENRCRIHLEIYRAIRQAVGSDYPVLIKLNCADFIEDGLESKDSLVVAQALEKEGLDALELTGGILSSRTLSPSRANINSQDKEAYFREEAWMFKQNLGIPLILVGGMRSFDLAEQLVSQGSADYVSMSRPFIREPDLVNRWKSGDRAPAKCISDNLCFKPGRAGEGIRCVTAERE
ncbi:2,4-dienoyl-CoA reductase [Desulfatibacillum alkenivorans DSM 16219]|jgi:2,4-dienoyl-CoA reductase-like NADH-dependent reductase (Old Yellow Enzyme family)|uniref:2,4-dienoyl-CoA reductase n=1 Tax=Desulfatibacillum alkenivorans DSM 16219 TaxID=1121393 RepID=A0A1M6HM64_9BACT|nr:NADH:flavin oxidoreductase [Desulfatibacillum alkenivorans]SHJ23204.1 2,4-dienoyl-CoA reductase [Desulfatibacillum alkenivorans DSM 16219]